MTFLDHVPEAATLSDGTVLHYVREGTGPTVIFIHGAMGDWRSWAPQWDSFRDRFDCVAYSRRYSHPNPNPLVSRDHSALVDAEDLKGLMDTLSIDKAILVGSSYGGFTALAMAAKYPDRVSGLVSVEAPMMRYAFMTEDGGEIARAFLANADDPARAAFEQGDDEMGVRILTAGIVGVAPEEVPAHVMERRMLNARAARSLSLSRDEFPLIPPEVLGAMKMPILLVSGKETAPVHRVIFDKVTASMPQARKRLVESSGHSVAQAKPDVFNADVLRFLHDHGLTTISDQMKV
ncbi:2-hydroxy-6-oxo-6-phenylhexa-2,4-dienoate hydrolase [Pelagimonas phthalicica]|uniref:2-hydroxy-6-oxo-6-phenylhexa-2,4-dienoate hydrolase n=1 Tax=Pelagimonas phthalicica TaxID=1037362 RepID=A0A238J8N9_9RHOB|nr:alpha/beta hydrolase [Pelagimonas phthalicica]TDS94877.1 pimeloyl-ACP methyl ester carboxylesterase [Pelagimonas phthalicica]SMX26594.1 2-hydroxy-6-oxo-6-phenylhexa-2,4-dienoate hydrolase [Pelagimonas phthalicica]